MRRLHFDGRDIVSCGELAFGCKEVYLHTVAGVVATGVAVEIKFVVVCGEHLRHDILHNHTLVHFQLVEKQFLVEFHGNLTVFVESMGDEQTSVGHIAFEGVAFHVETQPHIGCGAVVANIHDAGIGEPEEGIVVVAVGRARFQRRQTEFFLMFLQLCRYLGLEPTASLVSGYEKNPFAPLWALLLRQWGFKEESSWEYFYGLSTFAGLSPADFSLEKTNWGTIYIEFRFTSDYIAGMDEKSPAA